MKSEPITSEKIVHISDIDYNVFYCSLQNINYIMITAISLLQATGSSVFMTSDNPELRRSYDNFIWHLNNANGEFRKIAYDAYNRFNSLIDKFELPYDKVMIVADNEHFNTIIDSLSQTNNLQEVKK